VYNALGMAYLDSFDKLLEDSSAFNLWESFLLFNVCHELASISILHDKKQFVLDNYALVQLDNVLVIQHLQCVLLPVYVLH